MEQGEEGGEGKLTKKIGAKKRPAFNTDP